MEGDISYMISGFLNLLHFLNFLLKNKEQKLIKFKKEGGKIKLKGVLKIAIMSDPWTHFKGMCVLLLLAGVLCISVL